MCLVLYRVELNNVFYAELLCYLFKILGEMYSIACSDVFFPVDVFRVMIKPVKMHSTKSVMQQLFDQKSVTAKVRYFKKVVF